MNMTGNVLIHGATMILPHETGVGDLRIRNGVIETVALGATLEPHDRRCTTRRRQKISSYAQNYKTRED